MADLYFDYEIMMAKIDAYMNEYSFLSVIGIADSMLGRNIPALILGDGSNVVAYVGGEEGCDSVSPRMLLRFIKDICSLYKEGGSAFGFSAENILKKYTFVVVPMLNPDGFEYCTHGVGDDNPLRDRALYINDDRRDFSSWRGNARGVNLKYNYGLECDEIEPEPEAGALCNFLRFGMKPELLLCFSQSDNDEGRVYFGEGESENKIAIALSQMSGMKREYREKESQRLTLADWAIGELGTAAFSLELPKIKGSNYRQIEDMSFSCYAGIRKTLLCAPFLNKIK